MEEGYNSYYRPGYQSRSQSDPSYHGTSYNQPGYRSRAKHNQEPMMNSMPHVSKPGNQEARERMPQRRRNRSAGTAYTGDYEPYSPDSESIGKRAEVERRERHREESRAMSNPPRTVQEPQPTVLNEDSALRLEVAGYTCGEFVTETYSSREGMLLKISPITEAERLILQDFREFQQRQPKSIHLYLNSEQVNRDRSPGGLLELSRTQQRKCATDISHETNAFFSALSSRGEHKKKEKYSKSSYVESLRDRGTARTNEYWGEDLSTDQWVREPSSMPVETWPNYGDHASTLREKSDSPNVKNRWRNWRGSGIWARKIFLH